MSATTKGTAVVLSPRAAEAIQRLRFNAGSWDCDAFSKAIRTFGGMLANYDQLTGTLHRDQRRIFDSLAILLEELSAMDNDEVEDPDYDGPGDMDYGDAGGSPELRAAQDRDRV